MELETSDSAGSMFDGIMEWEEEGLESENERLCLMLACCRCDRVPALLFIRPFCAQKRWNMNGEVEIMASSHGAFSKWLNNVFQKTTGFESGTLDRDFLFGAAALCIPDQVYGIEGYYLAPTLHKLFRQNILYAEVDEDILFFRMDEISKDQLWKQASDDDRLLAYFDLLKLTIHSHPDVYSEFLWRRVATYCKDVIDSTIIPFVSVLEWSQLERHQSIIEFLIPFLIQYSISESFNLGTYLYMTQAVLRKIKDACTIEAKHMINLWEFREDVARQLLKTHLYPRQNVSPIFDNVKSCFETARLRGLFGILVSSIPTSAHFGIPSHLRKTIQQWRNQLTEPFSTMERLAQILLTNCNMIVDGDEPPLGRIDRMDLHAACAVASALIEHNDCIRTYECLTACSKGFETEGYSDSFERFAVTTELVKCYNTLGQNIEAEALALETLKKHTLDFPSLNEVYYMRTALADSYIGQGQYAEARRILRSILTESPSLYLKQALTLRLNKVERRLGILSFSTHTSDADSLLALFARGDLEDNVRHECLDELSSTIYYFQQRVSASAPIAQLTSTSDDQVSDTNKSYARDWRTSFFDKQIQVFKSASQDQNDLRKELKADTEIAFEGYEKALDNERCAKLSMISTVSSIPALEISKKPRKRNMETVGQGKAAEGSDTTWIYPERIKRGSLPKMPLDRLPRSLEIPIPEIAISSSSRGDPRPAAAKSSASLSFILEIKNMTALYNSKIPNQTSYGWIPPLKSQSLESSNVQYFRWCNGNITRLHSRPSGCQEIYNAASIFCEDPALPFLATNIDATKYDVDKNPSRPCWSKVQFRPSLERCRPNQQYSYIDFVATSYMTASPMPGHITPQLVSHPHSQYRNTNKENAGLIGELTLLIALAVFSARPEHMSEILTTCIRPGRWEAHRYPNCRVPRRGVVVTIYYDPDNRTGSTRLILNSIRDGRRGPFYGP